MTKKKQTVIDFSEEDGKPHWLSPEGKDPSKFDAMRDRIRKKNRKKYWDAKRPAKAGSVLAEPTQTRSRPWRVPSP